MEISLEIWSDRLKTSLSHIPDHMRPAVYRYVFEGLDPGYFLKSILANKIKEATWNADSINAAIIDEWQVFIENELPVDCHGCESKVQSWMSHRGLSGLDEWPIDRSCDI